MADYKDLAVALGVPSDRLFFHQREREYSSFRIRKRRGGFREMEEPVVGLKQIQKALSKFLTELYKPNRAAYGYVRGRNVKKAVQRHTSSHIFLVVDLEDFFPSITFPRVRGVMERVYGFTPAIATVIARLACTRNDTLPQGAPTSPIISNMIASRLDQRILNLAAGKQIKYTRYSDDLVFSSVRDEIPAEFGRRPRATHYTNAVVGAPLREIIEDENFTINDRKTRIMLRDNHPRFLGVVVNPEGKLKVPRSYFRKLRSLIYGTEKYGMKTMADYYRDHHTVQKHRRSGQPADFEHMVGGMLMYLSYIEGQDTPKVQNLLTRWKVISSSISQHNP